MTSHPPARGVHYTPDRVARYLASVAVGQWLRERPGYVGELTVLDAACGDGVLLGAVRDQLVQQRLRERRVAVRLVGVDIRRDAVEETRQRLATGAIDGVSCSLATGDALADLPILEDLFDVVVGNPPYVFGEHLGALDRAALAERHELGRSGQPDLFKLFYERTLGLLRDGGRHAFLVPDAVLARDDHLDLRRLLTERLRVDRICHVGRVFASAAGVATVVVAGTKARHPKSVTIDRWGEAGPTPSHTVAGAWLTPADGGPWSIDAPPEWFGPDGLRARLERPGVSLAELLAPGRQGLTRGEEVGKRRLSRPTATSRATWQGRIHDGMTPIYAGEDVRRHRLMAPSREAQTAAIVKNPEYYAGPKILFVKTGAGPVAATCDDDLPVLQSVYTLHLADRVRERIDEDAVVAILCSALLATFCWHRWTFGKRVQPQFTIANVRQLPLPPLDTLAAASEELSRTVSRIRTGLASRTDVTRLERELDERVASLYGLTWEDWEPVVMNALDKLPPSQRSSWFGGGSAPTAPTVHLK
jgi:hypothetical protein